MSKSIALRDVLILIKDSYKGFCVFIGVVIFLAFLYVVSMPNYYRADVLLFPANAEKQGFGSISSGYSLKALAGSLGESSLGFSTSEMLTIIKSKAFIVEFVREADLAVPLLAWKSNYFSLPVVDEKLFDEKQGKWVRQVSHPYTAVPNDWEIYRAFRKLFSIYQDTKVGTVKLSLEWKKREEVASILAKLVEKINEEAKSRTMSEAEKSLAFLKEELVKVSSLEVKRTLFSLMETQYNTIMLSKVQNEFAFKVVDPPMTPLVKSKPRRSFFLLTSFVIAFGIAVLFLMIRGGFRVEV